MPNIPLILSLIISSILLLIGTKFIKKQIVKKFILIICFTLSTLGIGLFFGQMERLNYNIWYSSATKELLEEMIIKMEKSENKIVLEELKKLQIEIQTGYGERGNYDELVRESIENLKSKN